jgi:anti-anti-sigma factor
MNDLAELSVRREGDLFAATLSGEIDLSNASDLERAIVDAVANDASGMLLDVSGLTYIDSAGVRMLLAVADRFRWRGQRLGLVAPGDSRVLRVLAIAGAERALTVGTAAHDVRAMMDGSLEP